MPIRFRCQNCRKRSSISSKKVGQSVSCPSCGKPTLVTADEDSDQLKAASSGKPLRQVDFSPVEDIPESPNARPGAEFELDLDDSGSGPRPAQVSICDAGGPMGTRPLSKSSPLTFGRHSSNDVVIDEEGVASLHCRISWNGSKYELTSADKGGVEINGTLMQSRVLVGGDVLRIGSFDIAFVPEEGAAERADDGLLAVTPPRGVPAIDGRKDKASGMKNKADDAPTKSGPMMAEVLDDDDGLEVVEDELEVVDEPREDAEARRARRERLKAGEENVLRSRIVLALGGTGILLVLASLVFWFLVNRDKVQKEFEVAKEEVTQGQFVAGIKRLEDFMQHHAGHALIKGPDGALVLRDKALIEKEITGATMWAEGLKALKDFVNAHRDEKYFEDLRDDLAKYSKKIAVESPKTAAQTKDRTLLELSIEAEQFFDRFSGPDAPKEAKREIAKARSDADATILKAGVVNEAFAQIDTALKANTPFPVVATRKKLIIRYPDMKTDKRLEGNLRKTLEIAKQLVTREELNRDAITEDAARSLPKPLTVAVRTRALSEEQSANRVVFALGQDACFGLDSITGDPLWRRTVGLDTPFFPVAVETSKSAVLMFDTAQNQVMLLDRRNGDLLWRQVVEPVSGPPLVVQGQIYLPTQEGFLYKIDADSGRITSRLKFPQKLLSPPLEIATANERHLVVIGDSEFAYTLSSSRLECLLVSYLGHQPGTIKAAPLAMGQYLLLAENDQADSSRLRAIDAASPQTRLVDVTDVRVEGHVRDALVLRGNQLFVTSSGPRLSVFNVSDDKNQRTLAPVSTLQIPTNFSGTGHLSAGADGQIWLSIGALRKVQLKTDVLQLDQQQVAVGQSTQPIQAIGRSLYVGRQLPISQAVHLTQADGESMQSNWKTIVGSSLIAVTAGADGQIVCASNGGDTFLISANEIANGGFRARAEQQLKLPENAVDPLNAIPLTDGRLAVWIGGAEGKLWVVGPTGQPQTEVALTQSLECSPLRFAGGILLPLTGRLKLAGRTAGAPCDDFLAPVNTADDAPARKWRHLVAIDDDSLFVIDNVGKLSKLQFRTGDKCFFQTITSIDFPQPIDVNPTINKGRMMTVDAAGTMRVLDITAMETRAEIALGGPASKPLWVQEPLLMAEVGRQKLVAFDAAQPKQPLWNYELNGTGLVGSPLLIENALIAVQQNGNVLRLNPKTGKLEKKLSLGQTMTHGPMRVGNLLVAIAADGSLYHVESLVPELPQTKPDPPKAPTATEKPADEKPEEKPAEKDEKPAAEEKSKEDKPASDEKKEAKEDAKSESDKSEAEAKKLDNKTTGEKSETPKAE